MRTRKKARTDIIDELLDLFLLAYSNGCEDANEMLHTEIAPTYDEMRESIYREVAGETWEQRVDGYLLEFGEEEEPSAETTKPTEPGEITLPPTVDAILFDIMRVADTDMHRIYNEAEYGTAVKGGAQFKTWVCTFVNSRDTHIYLHGTKLPMDAEFYTFMGNKAMFPGEFGVPEEDCNCHCYCLYSKA